MYPLTLYINIYLSLFPYYFHYVVIRNIYENIYAIVQFSCRDFHPLFLSVSVSVIKDDGTADNARATQNDTNFIYTFI
jgi:hypothetical protein